MCVHGRIHTHPRTSDSRRSRPNTRFSLIRMNRLIQKTRFKKHLDFPVFQWFGVAVRKTGQIKKRFSRHRKACRKSFSGSALRRRSACGRSSGSPV